MPYISIKCPKCGGGLGINSNSEKGCCFHCGVLINYEDAIKSCKVEGLTNFTLDEETTEKYKSAIYRTLKEISLYQSISKGEIEKHLSKAYSTNKFIIIASLLPIIFYIINRFIFMLNMQDTVFNLKTLAQTILISVLYVGILILVFTIKSGYEEVKRKIAVNSQINLFVQKCNNVLNPLGIVDLKYIKDISHSNLNIETEYLKLQNAQDYILNMDKSIFHKKPYIHYPLIEYLRGNKPNEYYK